MNSALLLMPDTEVLIRVDVEFEPMKVRIAENEVMFRAANERIESEAQSRRMFVFPASFLCECPDPSCTEIVELTLEEYEEIREGPTRFFCSRPPGARGSGACCRRGRGTTRCLHRRQIGVAGEVAAAYYGQDLDVVSDGGR